MADLVSIVNEGYQAFMQFQASHPVYGSMLTSEIIFPTADAISQLITDKKINWKRIKYTAALAPIYGATINYFIRSEKIIEESISESPLAMSALGPNLLGQFLNAFFYVNNTIGEKTNYNLKELVKHYSSTRRKNFRKKIFGNIPEREYLFTTIGTLTFWNAFQYFNIKLAPEEMQTQNTLLMAFVWTNLISLWSLKGGRRLVKNKLD